MTVTVTKPQFNIRDELALAKKKTGAFGDMIMKSQKGDDFESLTNLHATPLPYWENIIATPGQSTSYTFVDSGNRRMYIQNGNNGSNAVARMHGVLRGPFEIGFTISYQWGWGGLQFIPASNFNPMSNAAIDTTRCYFQIVNNNSNNVAQAWVVPVSGGPSTVLGGTAGFSSGTFKVWRDASGAIYYRNPSGTDTFLMTNKENFYVVNQAQSPNWVQLEYVMCRGSV